MNEDQASSPKNRKQQLQDNDNIFNNMREHEIAHQQIKDNQGHEDKKIQLKLSGNGQQIKSLQNESGLQKKNSCFLLFNNWIEYIVNFMQCSKILSDSEISLCNENHEQSVDQLSEISFQNQYLEKNQKQVSRRGQRLFLKNYNYYPFIQSQCILPEYSNPYSHAHYCDFRIIYRYSQNYSQQTNISTTEQQAQRKFKQLQSIRMKQYEIQQKNFKTQIKRLFCCWGSNQIYDQQIIKLSTDSRNLLFKNTEVQIDQKNKQKNSIVIQQMQPKIKNQLQYIEYEQIQESQEKNINSKEQKLDKQKGKKQKTDFQITQDKIQKIQDLKEITMTIEEKKAQNKKHYRSQSNIKEQKIKNNINRYLTGNQQEQLIKNIDYFDKARDNQNQIEEVNLQIDKSRNVTQIKKYIQKSEQLKIKKPLADIMDDQPVKKRKKNNKSKLIFNDMNNYQLNGLTFENEIQDKTKILENDNDQKYQENIQKQSRKIEQQRVNQQKPKEMSKLNSQQNQNEKVKKSKKRNTNFIIQHQYQA